MSEFGKGHGWLPGYLRFSTSTPTSSRAVLLPWSPRWTLRLDPVLERYRVGQRPAAPRPALTSTITAASGAGRKSIPHRGHSFELGRSRYRLRPVAPAETVRPVPLDDLLRPARHDKEPLAHAPQAEVQRTPSGGLVSGSSPTAQHACVKRGSLAKGRTQSELFRRGRPGRAGWLFLAHEQPLLPEGEPQSSFRFFQKAKRARRGGSLSIQPDVGRGARAYTQDLLPTGGARSDHDALVRLPHGREETLSPSSSRPRSAPSRTRTARPSRNNQVHDRNSAGREPEHLLRRPRANERLLMAVAVQQHRRAFPQEAPLRTPAMPPRGGSPSASLPTRSSFGRSFL